MLLSGSAACGIGDVGLHVVCRLIVEHVAGGKPHDELVGGVTGGKRRRVHAVALRAEVVGVLAYRVAGSEHIVDVLPRNKVVIILIRAFEKSLIRPFAVVELHHRPVVARVVHERLVALSQHVAAIGVFPHRDVHHGPASLILRVGRRLQKLHAQHVFRTQSLDVCPVSLNAVDEEGHVIAVGGLHLAAYGVNPQAGHHHAHQHVVDVDGVALHTLCGYVSHTVAYRIVHHSLHHYFVECAGFHRVGLALR